MLTKKILLVGAGQLGSRHLQGLKRVNQRVRIHVVDCYQPSLQKAQERYEEIPANDYLHEVSYFSDIESLEPNYDLAIISTSSNTRAQVIQELLDRTQFRRVVLEKLLFDRKDDYETIPRLFDLKQIKAWVNCSMRTMDMYQEVLDIFRGQPFYYRVTGSQYGLVTNLIHYLDHMASLADCLQYSLNVDMLEPVVISSKRQGFLELNGTVHARFANGAIGSFTCLPDGSLPVQIEIYNKESRYIFRESEGKIWFANECNNWAWQEKDGCVPFQSQLTTVLVNEILTLDECSLVRLEDSVCIHLQMLEPLKSFVNLQRPEISVEYPFT